MRSRALIAMLTMIATVAWGDPPSAWRSLVTATRPAASDTDAVLEACKGDVATLKAWIASDAAYERFRGRTLRRKVQAVGRKKTWPVSVYIRLPKGYDPAKRSYPMLLACHGQYSTGADITEMMVWLLGRPADDYVILAPTLPGPPFFSAEPYQEQAYLAPLRWAKRNLNIDDDRIYVSGYSLGGHNVWHLATMFPRHFAAALPMAGVPRFEGAPHTTLCYMENLGNLPLWAIWGELDRKNPKLKGNVDDSRAAAARLKTLKNTHFKGTELPGAGHKGCLPPKGGMAKYLAAQKRTAPPKTFTHRFHLRHQGRGYYVEAVRLVGRPLDLSKRLRVPLPPGSRGTQEEARQAVTKYLESNIYEMKVQLAPAGNMLSIRARRLRTVRVHVVDGMFDLSRPVKIQLNGRGWTGRIKPSARCMLTRYAGDRDAGRLIVNEIEIDLSGKATVRYPAAGGAEGER